MCRGHQTCCLDARRRMATVGHSRDASLPGVVETLTCQRRLLAKDWERVIHQHEKVYSKAKGALGNGPHLNESVVSGW